MGAVSYRSHTPKNDIRRFLAPLRDAFTTPPDGLSWPRAANTWRVAPACVEGLIRPGSHKTLQGIGKRLDINEHRIRRFISESPSEHAGTRRQACQKTAHLRRNPLAAHRRRRRQAPRMAVLGTGRLVHRGIGCLLPFGGPLSSSTKMPCKYWDSTSSKAAHGKDGITTGRSCC